MYVHDVTLTNVSNKTSVKLTHFGGDTSILITGKNVNELASNLGTINSIISWCDKYRLIINKDKSLALGFHHKLNKNIVFQDSTERQTNYLCMHNCLGLCLNHNLNWNLHAANFFKNFSKLCIAIKTLRPSLTYSMVPSPSWEANWFAASQEIPRISRNPKVHYCTHKHLPPVSILGQANPVHIPTSHLLEIRPNIIHPSTPRSPQWSLSLRFPHQEL